MDSKRKKVIEQNEVSEMYEFTLGGFSQKVLIEGRKKDLPVVVTLHGGPGTPIPFSAGCRGMFPDFTDNFIMVYWDQLGCGINDHVIDDSFSISAFADMAGDLIKEVKALFPENKLYIFSTSWGSVLSAKLAAKMPDMIDGVVACGQVIKELLFNDEVMAELSASKIPQKKLEVLKNTTPDSATPKELKLMSSCLSKYTNAYDNAAGKKAPTFEIIKGLLSSPDYSFKDFKAIAVNGYKDNRSLWKELLKADLTDELIGVRIPYVILQGDTDIVASTKNVQSLIEQADNSDLSLQVVKNCGHYPNVDMMDKLIFELKKISE